eukprot:gene58949-80736_t
MKLLRVGPKGAETPAILHSDGTYRDISSIVPDLKGDALTPAGLAKILPDPQNLKMWLEVDGHRYQNGSTKTMIFGV